jgi:hypothetical protein
VGCVAEPTARTTTEGVAYLSDDGVHLFDGNDDLMISPEINAELLPLDYNNLQGYHAAFDPYRKRYILTTPAGNLGLRVRYSDDPASSALVQAQLHRGHGVQLLRPGSDPDLG